MIRSSGPPAVNPHGGPPSRTSSCSTLSPLAPPFTVDRAALAAGTNPSPQPPLPPAAGPYPPLRSAATQTYPHPADPAFSASDPVYPPPPTSNWWTAIGIPPSFRSMQSSGLVEASPYYPRRAPAAATDGGLEPLPDSLSCRGVSDYPWKGSFDGEKGDSVMSVRRSSSWMDPSSFSELSAFKKGTTTEGFVECEDAWGTWHGTLVDSLGKKYQLDSECSNWFDDNQPPVSEESINALCNTSGKSISNALQNRMSYFRPPDAISVMDEGTTSSYDKYIGHLVSSLTDLPDYYSDTYSAPVYARSAKRAGFSLMDSSIETDRYSSSQNANFYNVHHDYAYHVPVERKERSINQKFETKDGCIDRSLEGSYMRADIGTSAESSLTTNGLFSTTRNNNDYLTEIISGLRTTHLNLPNQLFSECVSAKSDDVAQTSSETLNPLEQVNLGHLAVDSPCWKGVPIAQLSSAHDLVSHNNHLVQGQGRLPVDALYTITSPAQIESSVCMERGNNSHFSLSTEFSPVVSLLSKTKIFQNPNERGSDCSKIENEEQSASLEVSGGQSTVVLKCQIQDSKPKESDVKQSNLEDDVVSSKKSKRARETNLAVAQGTSSDCGNHVLGSSISAVACPLDIVEPLTSSNFTDNYSALGKDLQPIVKAIHGLSEILLSMYHEDADNLEDEQVVLQLVLNNLNALIVRNEKGATKDNSLVSDLEAAQSHFTVLKPDTDARQSNNQTNQGMKGNVQFIRSNVCNAEFDFSVSKDVTKDFGRPDDTVRALEKSLNDNEENPQTRLYKDDIAQALEESLNENEENPQTRLYKKLWIEAEAAVCSLKYELKLAHFKLEMGNNKNQTKANHDTLDVGKGPMQMEISSGQNSMHFLDEQHDLPRYKFDSGSSHNTSSLGDEMDNSSHQKPQEANTKLNQDDASVMARFMVLKSREDILSFGSAENKQKIAVSSSYPETENKIRLKVQPTKLADACFMERNSQPDTEADLGGNSSAKTWANSQHLGVNYNAEYSLSPKNSERETTGESQISIADSLLNHSFVPSGKGKHVLSGGYDSSSSEWEHVQEEEFTWYTNP